MHALAAVAGVKHKAAVASQVVALVEAQPQYKLSTARMRPPMWHGCTGPQRHGCQAQYSTMLLLLLQA